MGIVTELPWDSHIRCYMLGSSAPGERDHDVYNESCPFNDIQHELKDRKCKGSSVQEDGYDWVRHKRGTF